MCYQMKSAATGIHYNHVNDARAVMVNLILHKLYANLGMVLAVPAAARS